MLAAQYRLTKKEDWTNVMRNGSFFRGKFVSLKVVKSGSEKKRVGFLVRKKGVKQSVIRNKVKRRLRAAVSRYAGDFEKGFDTVIMADQRVLEEGFLELRAELAELFKKSRLIRE